MKYITCPICGGYIEYAFEIAGVVVPWLMVCKRKCSEICLPYQGMTWKEFYRIKIYPMIHIIFDGNTYNIELDIDPKHQTISRIYYSQFESWEQLYNREWLSERVNELKVKAEKLALLV